MINVVWIYTLVCLHNSAVRSKTPLINPEQQLISWLYRKERRLKAECKHNFEMFLHWQNASLFIILMSKLDATTSHYSLFHGNIVLGLISKLFALHLCTHYRLSKVQFQCTLVHSTVNVFLQHCNIPHSGSCGLSVGTRNLSSYTWVFSPRQEAPVLLKKGTSTVCFQHESPPFLTMLSVAPGGSPEDNGSCLLRR